MLRQGTPAPEFTDAAALRAHYCALRARMWTPHPIRPQSEAVRTRALAEAQRERKQREAEERLRIALEARAELDALVFKVLDPGQLAREPKRIIARVAEAFGLTYADIVGDRKTAPVIRARWAAIAAVREAWPNLPLKRLGVIFHRDHTSILHALRKIKANGVPQPPSGGSDA